MVLAEALSELTQSQAKFLLLKYCVCSRLLFLVRMLPLHLVQESLERVDLVLRAAADDMLGFAREEPYRLAVG